MITVKNLEKTFHTLNGDIPVLKGINQTIEKGEKVVIVGRQKMGMVFQHFNLFPHLTILSNITLAPVTLKLKTQDEANKQALQLLERVGLADKANAYPAQLSGGQKRRVAIAGVLAMRPKVLILDEPTAGLDPKGREQIFGQIKEYHKKTGSTVLLVSHSMEDVARHAQKVLVVNDSKLFAYGTVEEVFSRTEELVGMGLAAPQVTKIFMALKQRGFDVSTRVYTVEAARRELLRALERAGGKHA